jgi:hypothetical protein
MKVRAREKGKDRNLRRVMRRRWMMRNGKCELVSLILHLRRLGLIVRTGDDPSPRYSSSNPSVWAVIC